MYTDVCMRHGGFPVPQWCGDLEATERGFKPKCYTSSKFPLVTYDVDDNKAAYQYFPLPGQKFKRLNLSKLLRCARRGSEKRGIKK